MDKICNFDIVINTCLAEINPTSLMPDFDKNGFFVIGHQRICLHSQAAFVSKTDVLAHERDQQVAFVRKTGALAHERDSQVAFVSKTDVLAHERDQQVAFVRKTGALAHERDSRRLS